MFTQLRLAHSKALCHVLRALPRLSAVALCVLPLFLLPPAKAQTGGHWGVSFQVNGSTYNNGVTTPWQNPPASTNNSNSVAYSTNSTLGGGVSVSGTITAVFTWQPSTPGAPPPSSVYAEIQAQAIARSSTFGGVANDGLGDTDVRTNTGSTSTGTHYIAYSNPNVSSVVMTSYSVDAGYGTTPNQMSAGVSLSITAN